MRRWFCFVFWFAKPFRENTVAGRLEPGTSTEHALAERAGRKGVGCFSRNGGIIESREAGVGSCEPRALLLDRLSGVVFPDLRLTLANTSLPPSGTETPVRTDREDDVMDTNGWGPDAGAKSVVFMRPTSTTGALPCVSSTV